MADAKPRVGETVDFYDPKLVDRIGFAEGYSGRGAGPYAAVVVNDNGPGLDLFVIYPAKQPPFVQEKVIEKPEKEPAHAELKPYWDWNSAAQKARAAKRVADANRAGS